MKNFRKYVCIKSYEYLELYQPFYSRIFKATCIF